MDGQAALPLVCGLGWLQPSLAGSPIAPRGGALRHLGRQRRGGSVRRAPRARSGLSPRRRQVLAVHRGLPRHNPRCNRGAEGQHPRRVDQVIARTAWRLHRRQYCLALPEPPRHDL